MPEVVPEVVGGRGMHRRPAEPEGAEQLPRRHGDVPRLFGLGEDYVMDLLTYVLYVDGSMGLDLDS